METIQVLSTLKTWVDIHNDLQYVGDHMIIPETNELGMFIGVFANNEDYYYDFEALLTKKIHRLSALLVNIPKAIEAFIEKSKTPREVIHDEWWNSLSQDDKLNIFHQNQ